MALQGALFRARHSPFVALTDGPGLTFQRPHCMSELLNSDPIITATE
jgi:hypothetical protein